MTSIASSSGFGTYDAHQHESSAAQRRADKWMIAGTLLMGMAVPGLIGLPLFIYGLRLQMKAARAGLSVRPTIVTRAPRRAAITAWLAPLPPKPET